MKVKSLTLHFQPGKTSLGGYQSVSFDEGDSHPELHYIVRDGQHVVNYSRDGERVGLSFPAYDIRQVNTYL